MNAAATSSAPPDLNVPTDLAEPHEPHWISRSAFQILACCLYAVQAALFLALYHDVTWLTVLLILPTAHLMHGLLIGFHEASHGLLRKNRRFNEFDGLAIGLFSLTSFTLYRVAHQTHHMHLATERDEELWPFVDTKSPRWLRRLAAFVELTLGFVFTPCLLLRSLLRKNSPIRNKRVRRRIWTELIGMAAFWAVVLALVAAFGLWKYFFCMYLIPGMLAANLQSWRKYVEHVGLRGTSAKGATRSIVDEGWTGRLLSLSLLHEPLHGLHHLHMALPHSELPPRTAELAKKTPEETAPYPNYRLAVMDLLRDLADPKVGAQWRQRANSSETTDPAGAIMAG